MKEEQGQDRMVCHILSHQEKERGVRRPDKAVLLGLRDLKLLQEAIGIENFFYSI